MAVAKSINTIKVYKISGESKSTTSLPKEIISSKCKPETIANYVRVYLTNQRQGNASTKTRGEVIGSTRKIYRQKGTGRARHGSIKAPIFVGGGVVGGPRPRNFQLKINNRQRKTILFSVINDKLKNEQIIALTTDKIEGQLKTKIAQNFLDKIKIFGKRVLLIMPDTDNKNLIKAFRNIPKVEYTQVQSLNSYQVLKSQQLIFVDNALKVFEKFFINNEN